MSKTKKEIWEDLKAWCRILHGEMCMADGMGNDEWYQRAKGRYEAAELERAAAFKAYYMED